MSAISGYFAKLAFDKPDVGALRSGDVLIIGSVSGTAPGLTGLARAAAGGLHK